MKSWASSLLKTQEELGIKPATADKPISSANGAVPQTRFGVLSAPMM
ncbi:hypothetical protein ACUNV4_21850 [Granulosicoccus sp. 3-233]